MTLLNSKAKAGCGMFHHMFSSMNEKLDQIMLQYEEADAKERQQYELQLTELRKMSDDIIEEWLEFEEKFAEMYSKQTNMASTDSESKPVTEQSLPISSVSACNAADLEISEESADIINKGQGYYKLFMFSQAVSHFQEVVTKSPECNLARLFLGMTYMHLQNWYEAQRHFQLLISLSGFPKWIALSYNALGCIQAVHMNLTQAELLFKKAYETYPSFTDPLNNIKSCRETPQQLSLYFGSTELCCL